MEASLRETKLKEIKDKNQPHISKEIYYDGKTTPWRVFNIPLEYLIFNKYNGRIATFVKTYEKQHSPINETTDEGKSLIAQFLWDSYEKRNKITQKDLADKGQQEPGIVTADGVVIDGNRRFMLIQKNAGKNNEPTAHFKAIILHDTLASNPKEIMRLETTYQMGVDDKVDYSAIQKYLKCADLREQDFDNGKIAKMMGEPPKEIRRFFRILGYMNEYLAQNGYDGMYRILETNKLEGPFYDLDRYLETYKKGGPHSDWTPDDSDLDDLKQIYFDYIRGGFPAQELRSISNPAEDKSFFTKKDLWEEFSDQHFEKIGPIKDNEKSLQEMQTRANELDNVKIEDLILERDKKFEKSSEDSLKRNLAQTNRELEDRNMQDEPLKLLQLAEKTLKQVKFPDGVIQSQREDIKNVARNIRKMAEKIDKIADGKA